MNKWKFDNLTVAQLVTGDNVLWYSNNFLKTLEKSFFWYRFCCNILAFWWKHNSNFRRSSRKKNVSFAPLNVRLTISFKIVINFFLTSWYPTSADDFRSSISVCIPTKKNETSFCSNLNCVYVLFMIILSPRCVSPKFFVVAFILCLVVNYLMPFLFNLVFNLLLLQSQWFDLKNKKKLCT